MPPTDLSHLQVVALAGEFYRETVAEHRQNPGPAEAWRKKLRDVAEVRHRRLLPPDAWAPIVYGSEARAFLDKRGIRLIGDRFDAFVKAFVVATGRSRQLRLGRDMGAAPFTRRKRATMPNSSGPSAQDFARFMASLPRSEIDRVNELNRQEAVAQHKAFQQAFKAGKCSFCGDALTSFDAGKPCRHWLLKPEGVRKEHIEKLATQLSWGILENYVRWVANEEAFAQNINDLSDEGTGKLLELTVKYKNLAWSFSCSATDLAGHEGGGDHSKVPHWHFQMYVDDKPFVRYNDYHLPLSTEDAGMLELMQANPGKFQRRIAGGAGMSEVFHESKIEHIIANSRSGETEEDVERAPIKLDSIIKANPGSSIRGEDVQALIQAARAEGVTVTSKLRELKNVSVQTMVSPGPGVVLQAPRSKRKKRRDRGAEKHERARAEQQNRETSNDGGPAASGKE